MAEPPERVAGPVVPSPPINEGGAAFIIERRPRHVRVHQVTDDELDMLRDLAPSLRLAFFGITLGGVISFLVVVMSQGAHAKGHGLFLTMLYGCSILAAFFGLATLIAYKKGSTLLTRIRGPQSR